MQWRQVFTQLLAGHDLSAPTASALMNKVMSGELGPVRTAALLTSLSAKGVSVSELVGFARSMREHAVQVSALGPLLDTCGTGGSGLHTANISTTAAFVVASAGVKVAKHGNRSSSGRCGSSDLMEALGVPVALGPGSAAELLNTVGLSFLFAPLYHPAMREVAPVRRALGVRTVFNFLGPLCNPAGAQLQLLGVSDPAHAEKMARALGELGSERVLVVHGADGLDELSLCGPTTTWWVEAGEVTIDEVAPEDFGLSRVRYAEIQGGGVDTNVEIFRDILEGKKSPHADLVALNAGAALWVAQVAPSIREGVQLAQERMSSGAAQACFVSYREAAHAAVA